MIAFSSEALACMARSDGSTFDRLLEAHRGLVMSAARRAVGNRSWASLGDQALQGATVGLWHAVQCNSQSDEPWGRLAFRMARAEALRYIRADLKGIPGEGESLQELADTSRRLGLIDSRFKALAEVLASGSSQREAADALGLSHRAIRTQIGHLRREMAS